MLTKIGKFLVKVGGKKPMDTKTLEQKIIEELMREHGYSKYRIGKLIKTMDEYGNMKPCSWQTIHNWHRAVYHADDLHLRQLRELLIIARTKKEDQQLFPEDTLQQGALCGR